MLGRILKNRRMVSNARLFHRHVPLASGVPGFTTIIGLEVHAQLQAPRTKLFSRAPGALAGRRMGPNRAVDVFDAALPGTYPIVNEEAVNQAVRAALALGSDVQPVSMFERKHYYYYDLPSGYQITQQRMPIAVGGALELPPPVALANKSGKRAGGKGGQLSGKVAVEQALDGGQRVVRLTRLQLEQDSGKTNHAEGGAALSSAGDGRCLVDLNRAGVALVEFVFEPDLRSPQEAGEAVKALVALLKQCDLCDGSMENGALRVDLNVSVVPHKDGGGGDGGGDDGDAKEAKRLLSGNRVEVKNMNSVRHLMAAAEHEAHRQAGLVTLGQRVQPETRGFDPKTKTTYRQRSKEDAYDYRFFPEPDLPPLAMPAEAVEALRCTLPELPQPLLRRLLSQYPGLTLEDAHVLVSEPKAAAFFEELCLSHDLQPSTSPSSSSLNDSLGSLDSPTDTAAAAALDPYPLAKAPLLSSKSCAVWVVNHLYGALSAREVAPGAYFRGEFGAHRRGGEGGGEGGGGGGLGAPLSASAVAELISLVEVTGELGLSGAKKVMDSMLEEAGVHNERRQGVFFSSPTETDPSNDMPPAVDPPTSLKRLQREEERKRKPATEWMEELGLRQISNPAELLALAEVAVADPSLSKDLEAWVKNSSTSTSAPSNSTAERKAAKLFKFFVGKAMKQSRGLAKPKALALAVELALEDRRQKRHDTAPAPSKSDESDVSGRSGGGREVKLFVDPAAAAAAGEQAKQAAATTATTTATATTATATAAASLTVPTLHVGLLDFRCGVITKAWKHPDSEKLWVEEVDCGEASGPRQILSGLRAHYPTAEEMARKLGGIPSQGMVVCATSSVTGRVLFVEPPSGAAPGDVVSFEGLPSAPASAAQVAKKKMVEVVFPDLATGAHGVCLWKDKPFEVEGFGVCTCPGAEEGSRIS